LFDHAVSIRVYEKGKKREREREGKETERSSSRFSMNKTIGVLVLYYTTTEGKKKKTKIHLYFLLPSLFSLLFLSVVSILFSIYRTSSRLAYEAGERS